MAKIFDKIGKVYELSDCRKVVQIDVSINFFIESIDREEIIKAKEQIYNYFKNVFQSNQMPMTKKLEDAFIFEVL